MYAVCVLFAYHLISKRCRDDDVVVVYAQDAIWALFYAWPFSNIVVKLNSCLAKHAEWVNEHKITAVAKCLLTRPEIRKRTTKQITFITPMYWCIAFHSFARLLANFFIYVHTLNKIRAKQTQSKGAQKIKESTEICSLTQFNGIMKCQ